MGVHSLHTQMVVIKHDALEKKIPGFVSTIEKKIIRSVSKEYTLYQTLIKSGRSSNYVQQSREVARQI